MERTLYDCQGCPVAYIADDGQRTICLWDGHAVAYIDEQLNCYGWNGNYLGWVEDGVLFDANGKSVGHLKPIHAKHVFAEAGQRSKIVKHSKFAKSPASSRPARKEGNSSQALADFLKTGAVDSI